MGYQRFLNLHYQGHGRNVDYFLPALNSQYHVETTRRELHQSLRHVFSEKFKADPDLVETLEYEELVEIAFEGLAHFEQRIESLKTPFDLIGNNGSFRAEQWRSSVHEGPSASLSMYAELTGEMNLSRPIQVVVAKKIKEFQAAISAGVQLGIMQIKLGK